MVLVNEIICTKILIFIEFLRGSNLPENTCVHGIMKLKCIINITFLSIRGVYTISRAISNDNMLINQLYLN